MGKDASASAGDVDVSSSTVVPVAASNLSTRTRSTITPTGPPGAHSRSPTVGPTKSSIAPVACLTLNISPRAPPPTKRHPKQSSPENVISSKRTAGESAVPAVSVSVSAGVSAGSNKESAKPKPPQVSGLGSTVPSGNLVAAPEQETVSSATGSVTARQSPLEEASNTHGENTTGNTIPARRTEACSAESREGKFPESTSTLPAKTYSS